MTMKTTDLMFEGVLKYAREYKKYEGKTEQEIEKEVEAIRQTPMETLSETYENLSMTYEIMWIIFMLHFSSYKVEKIRLLILILQLLFMNKQNQMENKLKWYENSGHVITLGPEKEQLHEDILNF